MVVNNFIFVFLFVFKSKKYQGKTLNERKFLSQKIGLMKNIF